MECIFLFSWNQKPTEFVSASFLGGKLRDFWWFDETPSSIADMTCTGPGKVGGRLLHIPWWGYKPQSYIYFHVQYLLYYFVDLPLIKHFMTDVFDDSRWLVFYMLVVPWTSGQGCCHSVFGWMDGDWRAIIMNHNATWVWQPAGSYFYGLRRYKCWTGHILLSLLASL